MVVAAVLVIAAGSAMSPAPEAGPITWAETPVVTEPLPLRVAHHVDQIYDDALRRHGPKPLAAPPAPGEGLVAFEGLSTWIDTYDTGLSPEEQVRIAAESGVQTIFHQVSRQRTDGSLHDYDRLVTVLEEAHDRGLRVVVWTIPDFVEPARDRARAKAAMAFVTPRGDRPDGFGLDIETTNQDDIALRTTRLLRLSHQLREWAGPDYPMAAVVLPPLQLELNTAWWPDFPYAELAGYYDVMVPMSYSSYRGSDAATTHGWNLGNVVRLRELVGDPDLPVHLAGGIADELPEVGAFVQAARDGFVMGAGLYDLHTTPPEAWPVLAALRTDTATD